MATARSTLRSFQGLIESIPNMLIRDDISSRFVLFWARLVWACRCRFVIVPTFVCAVAARPLLCFWGDHGCMHMQMHKHFITFFFKKQIRRSKRQRNFSLFCFYFISFITIYTHPLFHSRPPARTQNLYSPLALSLAHTSPPHSPIRPFPARTQTLHPRELKRPSTHGCCHTLLPFSQVCHNMFISTNKHNWFVSTNNQLVHLDKQTTCSPQQTTCSCQQSTCSSQRSPQQTNTLFVSSCHNLLPSSHRVVRPSLYLGVCARVRGYVGAGHETRWCPSWRPRDFGGTATLLRLHAWLPPAWMLPSRSLEQA